MPEFREQLETKREKQIEELKDTPVRELRELISTGDLTGRTYKKILDSRIQNIAVSRFTGQGATTIAIAIAIAAASRGQWVVLTGQPAEHEMWLGLDIDRVINVGDGRIYLEPTDDERADIDLVVGDWTTPSTSPQTHNVKVCDLSYRTTWAAARYFEYFGDNPPEATFVVIDRFDGRVLTFDDITSTIKAGSKAHKALWDARIARSMDAGLTLRSKQIKELGESILRTVEGE